SNSNRPLAQWRTRCSGRLIFRRRFLKPREWTYLEISKYTFLQPPGFGARQPSGALDFRRHDPAEPGLPAEGKAPEDWRTPRRCHADARPALAFALHLHLVPGSPCRLFAKNQRAGGPCCRRKREAIRITRQSRHQWRG